MWDDARHCRKTTVGAGQGVKHLVADQEPGPEILDVLPFPDVARKTGVYSHFHAPSVHSLLAAMSGRG